MPPRQSVPDWRDLLNEAHDYIRATLGHQGLIPADEMVCMGREERDAAWQIHVLKLLPLLTVSDTKPE